MGLETFTKEVWFAKVFVRLRAALVHASTVNREYEGELTEGGDRIHISELEPIGVSTYTSGKDMSWSNVTSYSKELRIDQAKYYARNIDSIERVQSNVNLLAAIADEAGYGMAKAADTFLAGQYTEAGNTVSNATVSAGSVMVNLSNMQRALDDANVPVTERFMPIKPWYHQDLVQAATQAITTTGVPKVFSDNLLVNGYVGRLFGFNLLLTTQVKDNGSTQANHMGYHRSAIAFVAQLKEASIVNPEDRFGVGLKALYLYGAKVVRPEAMVDCTTTEG